MAIPRCPELGWSKASFPGGISQHNPTDLNDNIHSEEDLASTHKSSWKHLYRSENLSNTMEKNLSLLQGNRGNRGRAL